MNGRRFEILSGAFVIVGFCLVMGFLVEFCTRFGR